MTPALLLVAVLSPTNQMSYNTEQFYNVALAIVSGVSAAALAFRLVPPLSPALCTRRLLALTLRDLRRLTTDPAPWTRDWARRCFGRLSQLPEQAEPLQRAQLMAALAVGIQIIRLRRVARRLDRDTELEAALSAIARGDSSGAIEHLALLDRKLAALAPARLRERVNLRTRAGILAISEALEQHAPYFSSAVSK